MASSAKDIQLRELKDTILQLNTMVSEQTELIKSLRLMIDAKSSREKALQEQVDYLTQKLFGSSSERRSNDISG
ncbi:IS66 family transposase, partial [Romboutsia ilealis]|nr:IS66 family transposase [Romboutsia ilealis]